MKRKLKHYWAIFGFALIAILFIVYQYPQWFISSDQQQLLKRGLLVVSDQPAGSTLRVDYATLPFAGFIVVRNNMGDRLGDIVGVSSYYEPGRYKAIQIPVSPATYTGQALVVGIVIDNGDRQLNQADTLLVDAKNNFILQNVLIGSPLVPVPTE